MLVEERLKELYEMRTKTSKSLNYAGMKMKEYLSKKWSKIIQIILENLKNKRNIFEIS